MDATRFVVMWSRMGIKQHDDQWSPNHFVPCVDKGVLVKSDKYQTMKVSVRPDESQRCAGSKNIQVPISFCTTKCKTNAKIVSSQENGLKSSNTLCYSEITQKSRPDFVKGKNSTTKLNNIPIPTPPLKRKSACTTSTDKRHLEVHPSSGVNNPALQFL